MRNNSVSTRSQKKGGGAPGIRAGIPLQLTEGTMVGQKPTLQSVENPMLEQVGIS